MRGVDLIAAFEIEINKLDDIVTKPSTETSLYWLNQAVVKFTKDRFNGNAPKRTSYEQNEKRTRDLINLWRQHIINIDGNGDWRLGDDLPIWLTIEDVPKEEIIQEHETFTAYSYIYPSNMMYALSEDVVISDLKDENKMDTCVFECTADNFMYRINNSLTDFHYRHHRARPLRIRTQTGFQLLTDGNYKIHKYILGYLKYPEEITPYNPLKEYTDFEDNVWYEIIKIAAQMYIENQSSPRYKTLTQEVLTQE